jgi:hypothetical protein
VLSVLVCFRFFFFFFFFFFHLLATSSSGFSLRISFSASAK